METVTWARQGAAQRTICQLANFILPGQPGADSVPRIFTESVQIIGKLLYLSPAPVILLQNTDKRH